MHILRSLRSIYFASMLVVSQLVQECKSVGWIQKPCKDKQTSIKKEKYKVKLNQITITQLKNFTIAIILNCILYV